MCRERVIPIGTASNTRAVVLLSVLVAMVGGSDTRAADGWFLAQGEDAAVIGQDSDAATRVLAALTTARAVMRQIAPALPPPQVRAFAVRNEAALRELVPQYWERRGVRPHGASYLGPHGGFIAVRTDIPVSQQFQLLMHEYVHLVTAELAPNAPAWLNEGLSEFWGALALEGSEAVIGRAPAYHLKVLRSGKWLPLDEMGTLQRVKLPSNQGQVSMFYAQSWARVHYLLLGQHAISPLPFAPSDWKWSQQLDAALRAYITEGKFREVTASLMGADTAPPMARPISEARALAERANMVLFGERPDAALPMVRRALALDAVDAIALEVMGTHYFLRSRMEQAREWLARALDADPERYSSALYLALLAASPQDRERYLLAAVKAKPELTLAWQRLWSLYEKDRRVEAARRWCDLIAPLLQSWLWGDRPLRCGLEDRR